MASCNRCNCCNLPVCIHKVFGLLVGSCLCPSQPKLSWYATRIRTELPECRPKIRAHPQSQLVKKYASNCLLHVYLIYQYLASQKNADWNMSTDCAFLMKTAFFFLCVSPFSKDHALVGYGSWLRFCDSSMPSNHMSWAATFIYCDPDLCGNRGWEKIKKKLQKQNLMDPFGRIWHLSMIRNWEGKCNSTNCGFFMPCVLVFRPHKPFLDTKRYHGIGHGR